MKYQTYRLRTPNGVLLVRKLTPVILASRGLFVSPLVLEAIKAAGEDDDPKTDSRDALSELVRAAVVGDLGDFDVADLPLSDKIAVQAWASQPDAGNAEPFDERELTERDFAPLVHSISSVFLDVACRRYSVRPSTMLGVDPLLPLAAAIDLAVAYRGARHESARARNEDLVEVEDVYGRKIKLPRKFADPEPPARDLGNVGHVMPANVHDADDLVQRFGGGFSLGVGGGETGSFNFKM